MRIEFIDGPHAGLVEETDDTRLILTVEGMKIRPKLEIEKWDMADWTETVRVTKYRLVVPSPDGTWKYKVVE